MKTLDKNSFILIISFLLVVYITIYYNRVTVFYDPLIKKIRNDLINIDPRASLLVFKASDESFTEDKRIVYLCLRDHNGKYYDYNMIMYVAIHELAHAFSPTIDFNHTSKEFKENFSHLLTRAQQLGLYDPNKQLDYAYCPAKF